MTGPLERFPHLRSVRLQADRWGVRLKPDTTYYTVVETALAFSYERSCDEGEKSENGRPRDASTEWSLFEHAREDSATGRLAIAGV